MSFFQFDYNKPGKGIEKDRPQQNLIFQYFESYKRNFWKLIQAGCIYFLASIPMFIILGLIYMLFIGPHFDTVITELVGASEAADQIQVWATYYYQLLLIFVSVIFLILGSGPASAGFSYITRCMANEEHAWIFKDFKERAISNFKQTIIVSIIDILVVLILISDIFFYFAISKTLSSIFATIFIAVVMLIASIYAMMHGYIYHFIITFENKLRVHYKNAFILATAKLPQNFLLMLLPIVLTVFIFQSATPTLIIILLLSLWIGLTKYPMDFYAARVIKGLINERYSKDAKGTKE